MRFIITFLLLSLSSIVYSGDLDLAVDKTTVSPGDTVNFSVSVSANVKESVSLVQYIGDSKFGKTVAAPLTSSPYNWGLSLPSGSSGLRKYKAVSEINGVQVSSNTIELLIKPTESNVKSVFFDPSESKVLFPGSTFNLQLIGLFSDGKQYDITRADMGTSYSENIVIGTSTSLGDSPVIKVSVNGEVLAQQLGEAEVIATNNEKTAIRRIKVVAVEDGDSDGDNLTDSQEDSTKTNKYHPDSDGDGSPDNVEVGIDPTNPLDSNGDGIIDALDNTAMTIKDASDNYVSISTSAGTLFTSSGKKISEYPERQGDLAKMEMKRELLAFSIEGLVSGQNVDVTLDFDSLPTGTNKYLSYGSRLPGGGANEWYEFTDFNINGNRITLHLTDNQLGDSNPVPGVISDLGGPASDGSSTGNDGANGNSSGGGSFDPIFILLSLLAFFHLLRRR